MVNVPVVNRNSVRADPRPVGAVQAKQNPMGEAIGDGLRQLGGAARSYADGQDAINDDLDRTGARTLMLEAQARAREPLNEFGASRGFDAMSATPGIKKQLADLRNEMVGKATTGRMRRYFEESFAPLEAGYLDKISEHSLSQLRVQQTVTAKGEQAQYRDNAMADWADQTKFSAHIAAGLAAVEAEAQLAGVSGIALTNAKKAYVSGTRKGVVNQLLAENRQDDAIGYATVHRGDLTADDMLDVTRVLRDPMELRFAIGAADKVFGGNSAPNAPAGEGVSYSAKSLFMHGIVPIEGGTGKRGEFLTSPKGAIGPAQVMPGTAPEAAKLAGLPYDDHKYRTDKAYNLALGQAYYNQQLATFGDPVMAAAAYNAGPGNVRAALAKAKTAGGSWQDHVPGETKKYIKDFSARMGVSGTHDGIDESEVYGRVDAVAAQEKWTPEQKQSVLAEVDRRVARSKSLTKAREDDAYDSAVSSAVRLGDSFTDVSQLGTAYARMSPQQQATMTNMAEANRNARLAATRPKEGGTEAVRLGVLSVVDPETFVTTDLRPYQAQMTPGEYKSLMGRQAQYASKEAPSLRSKISSTIAFWSKTDGLSIDPKDDPKDFVKVYDDMEGYLRSVTGGKRQPTDAELRNAYSRATLSVAVPGALFGTNEKRRFEVKPGQSYTVPTIPPDVRKRIADRWKANHGGQPPNEDQISQTYVTNLGKPGFW